MRTFSTYLKKGNQNIDEQIGRHDLEGNGCVIHNSQYVALYGKYIKLLRKLEYKPITDEKRAALTIRYGNSARAAKFWATLPHNANNLSPTEKKRIQQNLNNQSRNQGVQ